MMMPAHFIREEQRLLRLVLEGDAYAREHLMELWMRQNIHPFARLVHTYTLRENWHVITPACIVTYSYERQRHGQDTNTFALLQSKLAPNLYAWDWNNKGHVDEAEPVWIADDPLKGEETIFASLRHAIICLGAPTTSDCVQEEEGTP